jgi:hypothetical protein
MLLLHPGVSGVTLQRIHRIPEVEDQIWDHTYPRLQAQIASSHLMALMVVRDMIRFVMIVMACHTIQVTIILTTTEVISKGW